MKDFQYITSSHPSYIENLYNDFVKDPNSVDTDMRKFFEGFDFAVSSNIAAPAKNGSLITPAAVSTSNLDKEFSVYRLISAYRKKGHLIADTNPIRERKDRHANLSLEFFGLSDTDLHTEFEAGKFISLGKASLGKILEKLNKIYAQHVGIEISSLNNEKKINWLTQAMEVRFEEVPSLDQRKRILEKLNEAVMFEKFLHTKFIGQKRFSLEGGETTIPALDAIINTACENGVEEIVLGMAHRGRLNVLANIMGKTYENIFNEFEGTIPSDTTMGSGDVKYHLGFSSELESASGKKLHLKLAPNPSHLEAVNPVVLGFTRSKADVLYDKNYNKILPILIHGDASLAGQGVVYEIAQMSGLRGYYTGGTIHFVINNQIGFTTDFDDARTSDYCTSLASAIQAPVLHVNGDDAEAVVKVAEIAAQYRKEFNSDIFIDMLCYRRHGHNEGDEPKFTQPKLYALIEKHLNPREVYTQYLIQNGEPDAKDLAKEMEKKFLGDLQERLDEIKQKPLPYTYQKPELWWKSLRKAVLADFDSSPVTALKTDELNKLFEGLMKWPGSFKPLRKVEKLLQDKVKLFNDEKKIDWATGELLAYSSLLVEGKDVRMSGQDVRRGTFSHRHACLRDEETNEIYNRLNHFTEQQSPFRIYNSLLSEFAVLGFEYGYSMANPNALVIWEAQFGDFSNGSQTIIDQFIFSAETKWQRMNGLVLLLPHGYEGQGPEHSSARMERFLQQGAEMNIVVTNITTAANFFHALRRQLAWPFRKPLINFSPKANLRHHGSYSTITDFTSGGFNEVYDDVNNPDAATITKVLFCSGKIYFELAERKKKENKSDVAIIRLEQLFPFPIKQMEALYKKYHKAIWYWVQEEPLNMGAAAYLRVNVQSINFHIIARPASAATATGFNKIHAKEQEQIIATAFSI
ncbi:MAG: 2-oxoglutarate dehydrogenase E1 component [Chitinophagaceae bacterium]|jgi:2-oxoglutarate dehydrogenase E1 component|nr:2-oxoglutarate dehydrogenase E1 component [Chitinophagaceae bacterium]MBP6047387.1 2-oxoglutarate dehydrogenase E1 component [Ferruginibacter sp.]MBL0255293.1 2-oxoglutarate dehydrogenase E1 component [Chitinophagaceae bacterium]MBP6371567.1 2-oxoglutarate dehydrogenase E1 component [Ferruginibacter sp.]MBP6987755.1 2-oxoglutarate dehydrogenase E1 component [Ferruginibacter sp.]